MVNTCLFSIHTIDYKQSLIVLWDSYQIFFHVGNPIRDIGLEAVRQKLGSIKAFEKFSIHILRGVKAKDLTKMQVTI